MWVKNWFETNVGTNVAWDCFTLDMQNVELGEELDVDFWDEGGTKVEVYIFRTVIELVTWEIRSLLIPTHASLYFSIECNDNEILSHSVSHGCQFWIKIYKTLMYSSATTPPTWQLHRGAFSGEWKAVRYRNLRVRVTLGSAEVGRENELPPCVNYWRKNTDRWPRFGP